jgi:predicted small integral membrane protein
MTEARSQPKVGPREGSPSAKATVGIATGVAAINALIVLIVCGLAVRAVLPPMPPFPPGDLLRLWVFSTFLTLMVSVCTDEKARPVKVSRAGLWHLGKVLFAALALSSLGTFASLGLASADDLVAAWRWAFTNSAYLVVTAYFALTATLGHYAFRWMLTKLSSTVAGRDPE